MTVPLIIIKNNIIIHLIFTVDDKDVGVLAESLHLVIDQWIQYKLGKQYLWKKVTQPWESNPGPTPIRGELATIIVSVGLKKLVAIRHYIQVG